MGLRIIGLEPDGFAIGGDRFAGKTFIAQYVTEVIVILRDTGIDRDRSLDEINGGIRMTSLMGNDAEQVQRIGVIRLLDQNPAIDFPGIGESARLVEGYSGFELLLKSHVTGH
jgi:hypothetical protein